MGRAPARATAALLLLLAASLAPAASAQRVTVVAGGGSRLRGTTRSGAAVVPGAVGFAGVGGVGFGGLRAGVVPGGGVLARGVAGGATVVNPFMSPLLTPLCAGGRGALGANVPCVPGAAVAGGPVVMADPAMVAGGVGFRSGFVGGFGGPGVAVSAPLRATRRAVVRDERAG
mmetsp:Transcript_6585/g.23228  ORF Transcript_6585/g.23228 Transcript_6585/m.23228 type:complete len:173 (+) Transcript_6585:2024-2542(+)